jgi:hypothetical protein
MGENLAFLDKNDKEKWSRKNILKFFHVQAIFYKMNLPHRKEVF